MNLSSLARFSLALIGSLSITTLAAAQTVLYVDTDAPGGGDGTSWTQAFRYLQDSLTAAQSGDEIRVAEGTYRPDEDAANPTGTGDRTATFQLITGVAIYGGYAGYNEPNPDERDIDLYDTILTGDLVGDDTPLACIDDSPDCDSNGGLCVDGFCIIAQNNSENNYHVVTGSGTGATALIDGCTMTAGNADGSHPADRGAGMLNLPGSPTIANCTLRGNSATQGGGMFNRNNSSPAVTNCTFSGNSAVFSGGGMANWSSSSPTVTDCTFRANSAGNSGGGMQNFDNCSPMVINCTFTGNKGAYGGGIYNSTSSNPTVTNCTFSENTATVEGGGMRNLSSSPTITNCTFSGNSSLRDGGGIYNSTSSNPTVTNCTFSGNSATRSGGGVKGGSTATFTNCMFNGNAAQVDGGAMWIGGTPTVTNCTLNGNTADARGGGMFNPAFSSALVTNCTLTGNDAGTTGGGMYGQQDNPIVTNCVLWNNTDAGGMDESAQIHSDIGMPVVDHSIVQGGWTGAGGVGNSSSDPLLIDADGVDNIPGTEDDNLRVDQCSPTIDAGDNSAVPGGITTDLDGNPRFVDDTGIPDTGIGTPPIVDMGAYEFQGTTTECCGDGLIEEGEECDDGNTDGGDGCSSTCTVEGGYTCDASEPSVCTDDDECALGTDDCDVTATCANTPGSFTCTCNAGYSGDGMGCPGFDATEVKLIASEGDAGDRFGWWVSISGDTVIVGAVTDDDGGSEAGSAYIFQRDQGGANNWGEVRKLTASDAAGGDQFGHFVAVSGDTAIVGADQHDDAGGNSGSAYIFQRDEGGVDNWGEVVKFTGSDTDGGDRFSFSVALDGDTAIVGALNAGPIGGSAYIFERNEGGPDIWGQVAKLNASDAATGDMFGQGVSVSGDTVIVGANGNDDAGSSSGSAYIFRRNQGGADNWGEVKKLTASDAASNDNFGVQVAISGDTAIVGAVFDDDAGGNSGSSYVFQRDQGGADNWGEVTKITALDAAGGDNFGARVAISGGFAVVGAYSNDDAGASSGSAYLFQRDQGGAGNWGEVTKITASDASPGDEFGVSVAISGDVISVGAWQDDDNGSESGSAYMYFPLPLCGDGCTDDDECVLDTDNCDDNATCTNTPGSFACDCNSGYSGDGVTCTDDDECTLGTDNCDDNATCTNTPGSFTCTCNAGYEGNGVTCTDIDECDLATDNCDGNATCTNTPGSFTCICNAGYSGDGVTCTDDDECALGTDNCDINATCTNTPGSFTCTCNAGYSGDGVTCTDDDECALGTDNCDDNATCANTPGSFTCTCNNGYSGDGVTCTDDDECTLGTDNCDVNATCANTPGSFTCTCNTGYSGDGVTCTDDDECVLGTDNCDVNATCTNTPGSFTCACNSGYFGDGLTCTDDDECTLGTDNCDDNATCANTPGSFTCTCNSGYSGDGVICTEVCGDGLIVGGEDCDPPDGQCCSDNCTFEAPGTTCDDGDECTVDDQCAGLPDSGCIGTYQEGPYGDVAPFGSIVPPCPADPLGELGDGFANMLDVFCAFNAFNEGNPYTICPCGDISPCGGDGFVNMLDVFAAFNAFNDNPTCPDPCP